MSQIRETIMIVYIHAFHISTDLQVVALYTGDNSMLFFEAVQKHSISIKVRLCMGLLDRLSGKECGMSQMERRGDAGLDGWRSDQQEWQGSEQNVGTAGGEV